MVRKFWLENGREEICELTNQSKPQFFYNPSGLGFTLEYSTIRFNHCDVIISEMIQLSDIEGELIFYASPKSQQYEDYFRFIRFISFDPMTLHYQPLNQTESYTCLVKVVELQKGEISTDGVMHCPIRFKRQTLWTSEKENIIEARKISVDGKKYPLKRSYKYGTIITSNLVLSNESTVETPFLIEVEGNCVNLMYNLYDEAGKRYGAGKILGTYDRIVINSSDTEEEILLERNGEVIVNPFNYQDLSIGSDQETAVTFLKLKPGVSTMNFVLDEEFSGLVRISWRNTHASV